MNDPKQVQCPRCRKMIDESPVHPGTPDVHYCER